MIRTHALIFGYNEYSKQILAQIGGNYREITLFVSNPEEMSVAIKEGWSAELFDLSDDWSVIEERFDIRLLTTFCALANDAENVFLTISLRSTFESMLIIALSQSHESTLKMKSAGADKVMPVLQIAANMIGDMITKPNVTHVIHDLLYEDEGLGVMEVKIDQHSPLIGKYLHDIDFGGDFDLILLAMVDNERENSFSFAVQGYNHHIDKDDVLVLMGDKKKLALFKQFERG